MTEHTPTPWYQLTGKEGMTNISRSVESNWAEKGVFVATVPEKDARFIVTACNRDHLFEEMRDIIKAMHADNLDRIDRDETQADPLYSLDDLLTRIDKGE